MHPAQAPPEHQATTVAATKSICCPNVAVVTIRFIATRTSALLPIAMSIAALGVLTLALTMGFGRSPDGDEGAAAHLWQLLIAGQIPVIAYFVLRWLPAAPREGVAVLATQLAVGLVAAAPVFLLHL